MISRKVDGYIAFHSARMVNADGLVTCNLKDFKEAKTKVYSPDELMALLEY